jgi:hypothetical protein
MHIYKWLSYLRWFRWLPVTVALMSGSLSLVREVYFFSSGILPPRSVFWTCAWIAFVISAALAWGQEHWRVLAAERQLHDFNSRERIAEQWLRLKERFSDSFQPSIEAFWERRSDGVINWWIEGGWDSWQIKQFEVLIEEAGNLASRSEYCRNTYPEVVDIFSPIHRWMSLVSVITGKKLEESGSGHYTDNGAVVTSVTGAVKDLTRICPYVCSQLAAKESSLITV